MKTIFKTFILASLLLGVSSLNAQNFEWAKRIGGTDDDRPNCLDIDASGNLYSSGMYTGTVDFDPGPGIVNLTSTEGAISKFILKLDASGNFIWVKSIDSGLMRIIVDDPGNVYVTGTIDEPTDVDPGPGITILEGGTQIFVLKLDNEGNFQWAHSIGSGNADFGHSAAIDESGNVYFTGSFQNTVDFDPGPGTALLDALLFDPLYGNILVDHFILKLDPQGNFIWARSFPGTGSVYTESIRIHVSDGFVYTTGNFRGPVDFDPGPGTATLTSQGMWDIFMHKMDTEGNFMWAKNFGPLLMNPYPGAKAKSIWSDFSGNVYTAGYFTATVDFDPGPGIVNLTSAGGSDIFVLKLDASGNFLWAKRCGGTSGDTAEDMHLDASGNIYTAGTYEGTVDFDPGPGIVNLTSTGFSDGFLQKWDATGNFLWVKSFGGTLGENLYALEIINSGSIYAAGRFHGVADFDPGPGITNLTSAGEGDVVVLKMNQAEVDGYVFVDANENGVKDLGEITVPIQTINYNNGNDVAITSESGFFRAFPPIGNQEFNLQLPPYYSNTTPLSQTINVQSDIIDTLYFGIQPISEVNDLVVEIHPYTSPRPGFTRNYNLSYQNVGTTTLDNVTLKFLKTEEDNVISATGTYTVSNDTLIWNIGALEPFSYGSFTITNTLSASATLGDSTLTQAWIIPSADDAAPENNAIELSEEIIGSYDPNDKTVTPEVSEPTENEPLEYVVRFQNTGNHQADFVIVRDTLSTLLDLTTFQMIAASHNYELAIENRIAIWTFPQINLPDSTSDEPGSHGFIKFKVQRVDGLGVGTQIPNRVGIYFDYNAPVVTNTCIYSIETCPSSAIDVQTACNSYTWIDGNTYTTSNNTATHILTNVAGCDSIVTLNLTVNSVSNIGTTTNGATITANNNNASYQWLDCDNNNEPIDGATSQTFTATESGNYAVELTENGCTSTSACVAVTVIGIDELSNGLQATVYPNPSQGNIEITLGSTRQDVELMLTDIQGRVIFTRNYPSLFKTNMELPDAKGVYVLKLKAQDSTSTLRLVKE